MAGTAGSHQQGAFSNPQNGQTADASVVLGNDNANRSTTNAHDADATIHIQSSVLASRPAAGTAQRVWITTDGLRAYVDSGAVWGELAYLPLAAGGTVAGAVTISSGGLTVSSGTTAVQALTATGVTVSTSANAAAITVTGSATGSYAAAITLNATGGTPRNYSLATSAVDGSFAILDNTAGGLGRLAIATSGAVTIAAGGLTISAGGATITAGGLTISAGGAAITGNATITGTLGGLTGLTVASGGITVTTGDVTVSSGQITASGIVKAAQQGMFGAYSGTGDAGSLAVSNNTIASASAGAATLPPTPAGFFAWHLGGTSVKVPYYN